jgi:hypothetical protein
MKKLSLTKILPTHPTKFFSDSITLLLYNNSPRPHTFFPSLNNKGDPAFLKLKVHVKVLPKLKKKILYFIKYYFF